MIYTAKRCCLIWQVLGTVQRRTFRYNFINTTLLDILYAIHESRERLEQNCRKSMMEEHNLFPPQEFHSPLHKPKRDFASVFPERDVTSFW
jgi:hypothetical protein